MHRLDWGDLDGGLFPGYKNQPETLILTTFCSETPLGNNFPSPSSIGLAARGAIIPGAAAIELKWEQSVKLGRDQVHQARYLGEERSNS